MGPLKQFLDRLDLDTLDFSSIPDQEYKKEASRNWIQTPCGSNYSDKSELTREYFDQIEEHRYETHPWLLKSIQSLDVRGKTVLEIGCGLGTDHLALARNGGIMHALDLGQRNLKITSHRLNIYGYSTKPVQGDGEHLPFEDESMDFVYSFGVLHHFPDTKRAVSEIFRVLKPGGKCFVGVYNKNSINFWWTLFFCQYLLQGRWKTHTLKQHLSLLEYPNDNTNLVVRLYNKKEFLDLFKPFNHLNSYIRYLIPDNFYYLTPLFGPREKSHSFLDLMGTKLGCIFLRRDKSNAINPRGNSFWILNPQSLSNSQPTKGPNQTSSFQN